MKNETSKWSNEIWLDQEYIDVKRESFNQIDAFLHSPPLKVLDIGCGFAYESKWLQEKYNCELFLLDGDVRVSESNSVTRTVNFGSASEMSFYTPINELQQHWDNAGMNYTFIDANNIVIPKNTVFDLVISNASCGFHYPLDTYYKLLKEYTDQDTIMLFDIKNKVLTSQLLDKFEVAGIQYISKKTSKYRIKLL